MNRKYLAFVILLLTGANGYAFTTIGWLEKVSFMSGAFVVQAKIDTGADNSSLDSGDWESFEKDGEEWIRFTIANNEGKSQTMEKPLIRYTEIKRKQADPVIRPVVELEFCLAGKLVVAPVNLADRKNFSYRMLVGRSALEGLYLVDSGGTYLVSPQCGATG